MKKDYFWNSLGVFLQNAISPLLLIVIARINGIFDTGVFSFAFSISIIFWAIAMWGGRTYQVSDTRKEFQYQSYIMLRLLLAIVVLVGALGFAIINNYDALKTGIILSLVLFKVIESIADALHGVLQVNGRLSVVGKALACKAVGGFLIFVVIDVITKDILLSSFGLVAVNLIITFLYEIRAAKRLESLDIVGKNAKKYILEALQILKRCTWVFAVVFLAMFSLNIPRYFIDMHHEEQNGYFGIIAMPVTLVVLLMTFILQPNVVSLSRLFDKRRHQDFDRIVRKIIFVTLGIGVGIFVVAFAIGTPLLRLIFGVDFSDYRMALIIMIAGGVVNALIGVFINVFVIMRRFKEQFYILFISNILLAVLSAVFVQTYGLLGGVSLFAVANVLQLMSFVLLYRVILKRNYGKD